MKNCSHFGWLIEVWRLRAAGALTERRPNVARGTHAAHANFNQQNETRRAKHEII